MTISFDRWAEQDDLAAAIQTIEDALETAQEQRDDALAILWAIAERIAPTMTTDATEMSLLRELVSMGADGAAEHLLGGNNGQA